MQKKYIPIIIQTSAKEFPFPMSVFTYLKLHKFVLAEGGAIELQASP